MVVPSFPGILNLFEHLFSSTHQNFIKHIFQCYCLFIVQSPSTKCVYFYCLCYAHWLEKLGENEGRGILRKSLWVSVGYRVRIKWESFGWESRNPFSPGLYHSFIHSFSCSFILSVIEWVSQLTQCVYLVGAYDVSGTVKGTRCRDEKGRTGHCPWGA